MSTTSPKGSLTQSAYERLLRDLLTGALRPGQRLKTADLCEALQTNLSAVREALARLTSQGLVVSEPQRGFRAAPVSVDDLLDLTRARVDIEVLCLRRAMAVGDVAWESGIVAALHALTRTAMPSPSSPPSGEHDWFDVHERFHHALCAACDSHWLLRLRELLYVQSERYRLLGSALGGKAPKGLDTHESIAEAVLARDTDRAGKMMAAHLEVTTSALLQRLSPATRELTPEQRAKAQWLREAMHYRTPPVAAAPTAQVAPAAKGAGRIRSVERRSRA